MAIFIAPIGVRVEHVKTWLKEEARDVDTLWLVHSKKGVKANFPEIAKTLEKELLQVYSKIKIKKIEIENALSVDPTMDAIHKIIQKEEDSDSSLSRKDFVINITGGTNISAAAAILAATFYGTRAHYVREPQKNDPRNKKYVDELPVQPIGMAKLNQNQLKVLKIIAENIYEIPNTPNGKDRKETEGSITRSDLLKKLGWDKMIKGTVSRREGNTRLLGITKKLEESRLISKIPYTEYYVDLNEHLRTKEKFDGTYYTKVKNEDYEPKWIIVKNEKEVRYEITAAGKRKARDAFMF